MKIIGRAAEISAIENMVRAGKHVLLEGPVGVGKTTLALHVAETLARGVVRVDGDGRFTEQKLVGSFDPKIALEKGFVQESFIPGPLYEAMQSGKILLVNELNRMPEMVQNVLLPALDEGLVHIPYLGELRAAPGFLLIATQNPREFVATSPLSEALLDRLEWIAIEPMSFEEEAEIIRGSIHVSLGTKTLSAQQVQICDQAVVLIRLTRHHPKIRRGASIRAALSLAKLTLSTATSTVAGGTESDLQTKFWSLAKSVLANRIELIVGKFSQQPFPKLLDELLSELRVQVEAELKKKS
jgi:MoxR-like ATPase